MKKIVSIVCLILCLSALLSGCGWFRWGGTPHSDKAETYLEDKYGSDFFEVRSPIYTRGINRYEYFFSENIDGGGYTFNVWEENGEFSDDFEEKADDAYIANTIRNSLRAAGVWSLVESSAFHAEFASDTELTSSFSYVVVPSSSDFDVVKKTLCHLWILDDYTISLYTLEDNEFYALQDEYAEVCDLTSSYIEDYSSYKKYSINVKDDRYEFWEDGASEPSDKGYADAAFVN